MDKIPEHYQYDENEDFMPESMRHVDYGADTGDCIYQDADWAY